MLNSEQLIGRFLKLRYPINTTCKIAKMEIERLRMIRYKKILTELKGLSEQDKRERINEMIEHEQSMANVEK
jgi:hypothetical protein